MAKHNPIPWEYENVEQPRDQSAYGVVKDADGKILFDTINADVAEICTEFDDGWATRSDAVAMANLKLAARAVNNHANLIAAALQGITFMNHALEFFGWAAFPSLEEEVRKQRDEILEAIRIAEGK